MNLKELAWVGSSKKDLVKFSDEVKSAFGYGLYMAQCGESHPNSKVLKGFSGAQVIELKESDSSGTFRAVYTTRIKDTIFVLHAFQKKSKTGIETPKADIDLIKSRLALVEEIYNNKSKKK